MAVAQELSQISKRARNVLCPIVGTRDSITLQPVCRSRIISSVFEQCLSHIHARGQGDPSVLRASSFMGCVVRLFSQLYKGISRLSPNATKYNSPYHTLSGLILTEHHVLSCSGLAPQPTYAPRRRQEARTRGAWLRHACHSCRVRTRSEHRCDDTCHLFEHDVQTGGHWEKQGRSSSARNREYNGADG